MDNDKLVALYRFVTEQSVSGVCAIDQQGNVLIYNKKMRELMGVTDEQFEKQKALEIVNGDFQRSELFQVIETAKPIMQHKATFWNKRGEEVTTISNIMPLIVDGELLGAVEFVRDITQQQYMMYQPLRRYGAPLTFDIITAVSDAMKRVIQIARAAALGRIPVMLIGESGTGKDMIAEGIHHALIEKNELFITLICRRDEETVIERLEKASTDPVVEQQSGHAGRVRHVLIEG